jgi:predicted CoA-binding protein
MEVRVMLDTATIDDFLAQRRLAVVGLSQRPTDFATTIYKELRRRGYDAIPVGRNVDTVDGAQCYRSLTDVPGAMDRPGSIDGVVVMVGSAAALGVIEDAAVVGIPRVWLFKGLGGKGALSEPAVSACRTHGMQVVEGACPMMFLDPVTGVHRVHRFGRRLNGSLPRSGSPAPA